eukprot:SAG11_NODE_15039_length_591_cov_0.733740_1_plen_23_part_10
MLGLSLGRTETQRAYDLYRVNTL